jgi:hypothetical protein
MKFDKIYQEIMNESEASNAIEMIKKSLEELGVSFELNEKSKIRPFKVIYKPTGKSDEWYDKFEDVVDRFNLSGVVKQKVNEEKESEKFEITAFSAFEKPQKFIAHSKKEKDEIVRDLKDQQYKVEVEELDEVQEEMDYITVDLKIKLQNGDYFTTGFNISNKFLETQTPLEVAKKYYLGKPYTYSDETSSRIVSVELLDSEEEYAFYKKKS